MKKYLKLILCLFVLNTVFIWAAEEDVVGIWQTPGGDYVSIFEENSEYVGEILMLMEPIYPKGHELEGLEKIDTENPDDELRNRKVEGMRFLWGFKFDKNSYVDGKIYDPGSGKTYYCKMKLKNGSLKLRGSVDSMGLLGSSQEWTRVR